MICVGMLWATIFRLVVNQWWKWRMKFAGLLLLLGCLVCMASHVNGLSYIIKYGMPKAGQL